MTSFNVIAHVTIWCIALLGGLATSDTNGDKYRMNFPEEQETGTRVANLAEIFSLRPGERVGRTFEILGQRLMSGHKVITSDENWLQISRTTGIISVKNPMDRETECGDDPELECVIVLQTAMMPQAHFKMQTFEFVVTDVNDHAPKFPDSGPDRVFSLNISEDIPEISTISLDQFLATDQDTGDNAKIYYSISRNEHFGLNQFKDDTGAPHLELVIIKQLDYEDTSSFELTLTAKDRGSPSSRSSSVFLRINVLDANDNHPVFDEPQYVLELRENLPKGHVITTVVARDVDTGAFGRVRYFIPKAGNSVTARRMVGVDPVTGVVKLLQPLDRETRDTLRVVIAARDQGRREDGGSKTGKTMLLIHVADVNDNPPRIHINIILKGKNKETAYVPENVQLGTYVAHVSATDADKGQSGEVHLTMTSTLNEISLDPVTREKQKLMTPVRDHFILKPENLIATNTLLDREVYGSYVLKVKACDSAKRMRCSEKNVTIVITDTNDNSPKFISMQKVFTLPENTVVGNHLTSIRAYDEDSRNTPALTKIKEGEFVESLNGEVRYSLSGGGAVFAIDSKSGKITLVGTLDFETKRAWKLIATAQDLGNPPRKSNFTLLVKVTDVNDHKPEFSTPALSNSTVYATILEDRTIVKIKAIDRDQGANAKLWYSITSEDGEKRPHRFILDPVTGRLRLNSSNKLTELLGKHALTITVQDKGNPPLKTETRLIVDVTDLPLSSIIPDYMNEEESSRITVIVLASLASATVFLLLVLACIVVKCRKENKEIRKYSCRGAESKSGRPLNSASKSSMSQLGSVDEVLIVNTPGHVTSTRDSNFGRAMEITRSRSVNFGSNRPDAVIPTAAKYATTERQQTTFSTFMMGKKSDTQNDTTNAITASHTDRDSGKGESDKDTDSYGGDKDNQGSEKSSQPPSQYCSGYLNELGPRCTISCRKYGHSDECWMPVVAHCEVHGEHDSFVYSDAGSEASDTAFGNKNYSEHYIPLVNTLPPRYGNFDNCGLETISETQPLRTVLDSGKTSDQNSMYSYDTHSQRDYPLYHDPQMERYHAPVSYYEDSIPGYPTYPQVSYSPVPEQPDWRDMYRVQQPPLPPTHSHIIQPQRPASAQGYMQSSVLDSPSLQGHHSHRNISVSPSPSNAHNSIGYSAPDNNRCDSPSKFNSSADSSETRLDGSVGSVMEKVKRFSQSIPRRPSLRDQVLKKKFESRNDVDSTSPLRGADGSPHHNKLQFNHNIDSSAQLANGDCVEETQRILSDIDTAIKT